ncbi:hypothetical protein ARMSODRAFT_1086129 [Armillaria solidipes]|uniref:Uncharacterized protein n=1 Tax=Armillaria solidipes TaxID=1076256 RepID=A0A2H3BFE5_9AGAR|nr:hypothetical protein ARMSODRAFT_1086129 [Armillaria solidipes]
MATQGDIPSDLTDDDKAVLFRFLDANLNSEVLYALLHGIYTGVLAVTLWNIFVNKRWPIRRALVVVIILLHALITINFAANWLYICSAFIDNGKSFWTVYLKLNSVGQAASLEAGIAASMSTILTDLYIIWCCWIVWGRRWPAVLLPILSLISATGKVSDLIYLFHISNLYVVAKGIEIYHDYSNAPTDNGLFPILYISFILATTLWCTLLIIYRILTVAVLRRGTEGRLRVYRRFIEVLVESSALYSISLILYLGLTIREDFGLFYLDTIASIAKGLAPTFLVGRAAVGHTRPKDDQCNEITASTLHFQTPSEVGMTSFQESTTESTILEIDIEAQPEQSEGLVVSHETNQAETLE